MSVVIQKIKIVLTGISFCIIIFKSGGNIMERVVKTVRFPVEVLREMRPIMKEKKMNFTAFIIEAINSYLRTAKYKEGINSSFGAWENTDHPELKDGADQYIRNLRKARTDERLTIFVPDYPLTR